MHNVFSYYLLAFKNSFDYKNTAIRSELNWFILFWFIFWMIFGFLSMVLIPVYIMLTKNDPLFLIQIMFTIAILYMFIHFFPLLSLIKRRFNSISPQNAGKFFAGFAAIWFVQIIIIIGSGIYANFAQQSANVFVLMPLVLLGQLCGLIVMGVTIFLMVKDK